MFQTQAVTIPLPKKISLLNSHDKEIKDARHHVTGAMDVLLRILQDCGVADAT